MSAQPLLTIGGVVIAEESALSVEQEFVDLQGEIATDRRRTVAGDLKVRQVNWSVDKVRVTVRGVGWWPIGLKALLNAGPLVVQCGEKRAVGSSSNSFDLPASRRSDAGAQVVGYAVVDGRLIATSVESLVGDTLTLAIVNGAQSYVGAYYPEITADVRLQSERTEHSDGSVNWRWLLVAEEI